MRHVFCYGSLMFPEVWHRVVQGRYDTLEGALSGYERRGVKDELFPCLIPGDASDLVQGVIYLGVGSDDLTRLDAFEGPLYDRQAAVCRGMDHHLYAVDVYILKACYRALVADEVWDAAWFAREDLPRFLSGLSR